MKMVGKKAAFTAFLLILAVQREAVTSDWPTYRFDPARTGYTPEKLPARLSLRWSYRLRHTPVPAWPRSRRMTFDRAFEPVIAGGLLYFGSSADGKVCALDAQTGIERWSFFTDGPVRFAPAVWRDRVFVASDDGHLYCLSAKRGELLWKKRGGPDDSMVLGNGRMISRWPARGGPVILDGTVYFAAGIWPSEGIHLYALGAARGEVLWHNSTAGSIEMNQPHGGARAKSGISAQGYLVAGDDKLLVPTGRAVPAAFDRADGGFRYFHLQEYGHKGGSAVSLAGDFFVNGGDVFDVRTGKMTAKRIGQPVACLRYERAAVTPPAARFRKPTEIGGAAVRGADHTEMLVGFRGRSLNAWAWVEGVKTDRKGNTVKAKTLKKLWSIGNVDGGGSLVVAGKTIVSGGAGRVTAADIESRRVLWSLDVDGAAVGLAVAEGRLYVSTDRGTIHCFDGRRGRPAERSPRPSASPYGANATFAAAAREIIKKTGITQGYCVDLSCGEGALAYELAKRTRLRICAVESDPKKAALARRKLDAAGLYGARVSVHTADPARTPYPSRFANLVVSGRSVVLGPRAMPKSEAARLVRPYGGVVVTGRPGSMRKTVRGALEGAGSWTHQYCSPANTLCSTDSLVKGPLRMLWFTDLGLAMPQRHGRGPAPLFSDGRLFVEGLNAVRAFDAYNGLLLWEFPLTEGLARYNQEHLVGVAATGSNFCTAGGRVYVASGGKCIRLDAVTGEKLGEFRAPRLPDGMAGTWGFLACAGGTLFGSVVDEEHIVKWAYHKSDMRKLFTESRLFFALDAAAVRPNSRPKWTYAPEHSIRHNAVAIGGGRVYLIDRPPAEVDRIDYKKPRQGGGRHAPGKLCALDARTGRVLWKVTEDIYGTMLALSVKYDVLLMSYQRTRFRLPSERGGRMAAFSASRTSGGRRLWDIKASYASRPLINNRTIYAQPGAWDLLTGKLKPFKLKRSYGCGIIAGSPNMLFFRSATVGFVDLRGNRGAENYGGIRPACWINMLPAGGLLLMPDATDGCRCSYLIKASVALQPVE